MGHLRVLLYVIIAFFGCYSHFSHRKRWEADRVQGDRRDYIFDLDHNIFGEEGPIQNQYSVDGYAKGTTFPHLELEFIILALYQGTGAASSSK
jgi:hypothetical protein